VKRTLCIADRSDWMGECTNLQSARVNARLGRCSFALRVTIQFLYHHSLPFKFCFCVCVCFLKLQYPLPCLLWILCWLFFTIFAVSLGVSVASVKGQKTDVLIDPFFSHHMDVP
jgi:hypothetical protein